MFGVEGCCGERQEAYMLKAIMPGSLQVGEWRVCGAPHLGICPDKLNRVVVVTRSLQLEAVHGYRDLLTAFPDTVKYSLMV